MEKLTNADIDQILGSNPKEYLANAFKALVFKDDNGGLSLNISTELGNSEVSGTNIIVVRDYASQSAVNQEKYRKVVREIEGVLETKWYDISDYENPSLLAGQPNDLKLFVDEVDVQPLVDDIEANETAIQILGSAVSDNADDISNNVTSINNINTSVSNINDSLGNLNTSISNLNTEVSDLDSSVNVLENAHNPVTVDGTLASLIFDALDFKYNFDVININGGKAVSFTNFANGRTLNISVLAPAASYTLTLPANSKDSLGAAIGSIVLVSGVDNFISVRRVDGNYIFVTQLTTGS